MSTAAMIGLGVLAWILLSILLALFVGRMIQLRDRQRPDRSPPVDLSATDRGRRRVAAAVRAGSARRVLTLPVTTRPAPP